MYFGTDVINDWTTVFDIAIVLKTTIFPSSVKVSHFPYFHTR